MTDEQLAEIEALVLSSKAMPRAGYRIESLAYYVPALVGEVRRLREDMAYTGRLKVLDGLRERAEKAKADLAHLAKTALVAMAGGGICTPVEGYAKAPHCLAQNIGELRKQRDEAMARVAVLREALRWYADSDKYCTPSCGNSAFTIAEMDAGGNANTALHTLDHAADKLMRELETLRKVAETALAYDQRRGPKGQLGSADETMALRDAHRAALAAWCEAKE